MKKEFIKVISRKFDQTIHKSWQVEIVKQNNPLLELVGEFDSEIKHRHLGVIRPKTVSYEYYWLDRWYNIFRFHEPDGALRNFYCNINMPPTFEHDVLDYIDLDIDVLIWKDFSYEILDLDEFKENTGKYSYPADLRKKAASALDELTSLIENRVFPFDYQC